MTKRETVNGFTVSTIAHGSGFESMLFDSEGEEVDQIRTATVAKARKAHKELRALATWGEGLCQYYAKSAGHSCFRASLQS